MISLGGRLSIYHPHQIITDTGLILNQKYHRGQNYYKKIVRVSEATNLALLQNPSALSNKTMKKKHCKLMRLKGLFCNNVGQDGKIIGPPRKQLNYTKI